MKKKLIAFTGAGMSAESGLGTFRDSGGLWEQYKIEDVATPEAWKKNQELVQSFYNKRRKDCIDTKPNQGHFDLVELEKEYDVYVITQNIDDLHERAGSNSVLHLHGEIRKSKCSICDDEAIYNIEGSELNNQTLCPKGHQLRPHVVWFGEEVPELFRAANIIEQADILIVIGTSLNVYPAANLIHYTNSNCEKYIIDPNNIDSANDFIHIKEKASLGVRKFIDLKQKR